MDEMLNLLRTHQGVRLNIDVGSRMRFMMEGHDEPIRGTLVGLDPPEYLIVRMDLPVELANHIQTGTSLAVGYISLGNEYGFTATIIHRITVPDRLLFITYPDVIQNIDVRRNTRVSCFIPATALLDERQIKGTLIDISRGGCRFIVRLPATLQARQIRLIDEMTIQFPLMGIDGLQTFACQVRNTTIDRERIAMGVEFIHPDKDLTQRIDSYIQMITQLQQEPPHGGHP